MRQWTLNRKPLQRLPEGTDMVSIVRQGKAEEGAAMGQMERVDIPVDQGGLELTKEKEVLGWWRWKVKSRPPTQKELNERLEQLFLSLMDSQTPHKDALVWLTGLYLTRKKIVRQEPGAFTHVKSGERMEVKPDAIKPEQMEMAMGELMGVIE